jgi:hypothetical protein
MKSDEIRPIYEEIGQERDIPARAVAVSDYLVRPPIQPLDRSSYAGQIGNRIYFVATDNVGLAGARVTISDIEGNPFESGIANEVDSEAGLWMYTTMTAVPAGTDALIKVQVSDRPGN